MSILLLSGLNKRRTSSSCQIHRKKKPTDGRRRQARHPQRPATVSEAKKQLEGPRSEWLHPSSLVFSVFGGEPCTFCLLSFSSISTVSYLDDIGHHDEHHRMAVTMENTYQLGEMTLTITYRDTFDTSSLPATCPVFSTTGPHKHFPAAAATDILKDVLTSYLQEEKYEVEWSQKMTKTLCEVSEC